MTVTVKSMDASSPDQQTNAQTWLQLEILGCDKTPKEKCTTNDAHGNKQKQE